MEEFTPNNHWNDENDHLIFWILVFLMGCGVVFYINFLINNPFNIDFYGFERYFRGFWGDI